MAQMARLRQLGHAYQAICLRPLTALVSLLMPLGRGAHYYHPADFRASAATRAATCGPVNPPVSITASACPYEAARSTNWAWRIVSRSPSNSGRSPAPASRRAASAGVVSRYMMNTFLATWARFPSCAAHPPPGTRMAGSPSSARATAVRSASRKAASPSSSKMRTMDLPATASTCRSISTTKPSSSLAAHSPAAVFPDPERPTITTWRFTHQPQTHPTAWRASKRTHRNWLSSHPWHHRRTSR